MMMKNQIEKEEENKTISTYDDDYDDLLSSFSKIGFRFSI